MPRPARRHKRRSAGFEDLDTKHLLDGPHGVPCRVGEAYDRDDTTAVREAWESLRSELMPPWIRQHPGQRPWAWWEFEAPGRRERTDGKPHPFDNKQRTLHVAKIERADFSARAYALGWGLPSCCIPPFDTDLIHDFYANRLRGKPSQVFEDEWEFLVRHNLLLPEDSP